MTRLENALACGDFVVTTELNPPKGTDLSAFFAAAQSVGSLVTAVNLTDSHAARMSISPLATAHLLLDQGIEPILQMTGRDRNRIALQGDLLGAHVLGVKNIVCMGGDPPNVGDHPEAKPVFDLSSPGLIQAACALNQGRDLAGNALNQATELHVGAVVNPGADDLSTEISRLREKVDAGATFFQTQAVYEASIYERFANAIHDLPIHVLVGIIPLKSLKMAQYLHDKVPGISIPEVLFKQLEITQTPRKTGVEIAARTVQALRPLCAGVHLMTLGWESEIGPILQQAGID